MHTCCCAPTAASPPLLPTPGTHPPLCAGLPPAPSNLQFSTASLQSVVVGWDAAPTAARYEIKLLQTAPTAKVAATAIVEDDGGPAFTQTLDNLTPGRYSVSIECELQTCFEPVHAAVAAVVVAGGG